MGTPPSVEAYLAAQPEPQRTELERLRALVHRVLPDAEETISYGVAGFRSHGKVVVWIAGWKAHVSMYPLTDAFAAANAGAIKPYQGGKGTLKWRPDGPPADDLLEALVTSRLAEIEAP